MQGALLFFGWFGKVFYILEIVKRHLRKCSKLDQEEGWGRFGLVTLSIVYRLERDTFGVVLSRI